MAAAIIITIVISVINEFSDESMSRANEGQAACGKLGFSITSCSPAALKDSK